MRETWRAFRVVVGMAFRADPLRTLGSFVFEGVGALSYPLVGLWLKLVMDGATTGNTRLAVTGAIGIGASSAAGMVMSGLGVQMRLTMAERTGYAFERRTTELVAGLPGIEHLERPEYLDKLQQLRESRGLLGWAANSIAVGLSNVIRFGGILVLLATLHPLLIVLPAFAVPIALVQGRFNRKWREVEDWAANHWRLEQHLYKLAMEAGPAKELRVFGLERELLRRHAEGWQRVMAPMIGLGTRVAVTMASLWALFGAAVFAAVLFVAWRAANGDATPGDVVLAITASGQVGGSVVGAAFIIDWLLRSLRNAARFVWLLDYSKEAPAAGPEIPPDRLRRGIAFEGVSFSYPGTDAPVLRDISLDLPAGSVVALVGENGAGKTSLVKLLCGFYAPTDGRITVDGTPLDEFTHEAWRERVAAGFQDFAKLELVTSEAVGVGDLPHADDEPSVMGALERAGASDLPASLPAGLATQLGREWESGVELSTGQWQKVALGRALMRTRPLLLIFDEPTAALDAPTEHALFERFAGAAKREGSEGAITLLVSHRFSTVRMADLIVVVEGGRVLDVGSHAELMVRGGLYSELFEIQARAYR